MNRCTPPRLRREVSRSAPESFHLLVVSGDDEQGVRASATRLADALEAGGRSGEDAANNAVVLRNAVATLRTAAPRVMRASVVAADIAQACARLRQLAARGRVERSDLAPRSTAFLFCGVGEQYPGMMDGLLLHPAVTRVVDRCLAAMSPISRTLVRDLLGQSGESTNDRADPFAAMVSSRAAPRSDGAGSAAQLATFVTSAALAALWESVGVRPSAVLGYSLGEYTAACVAGVFEVEDAIWLLERRAELVALAPPGRMLTVAASAEEIAHRLADAPDVAISAVVGPRVCVLSGSNAAIDAVEPLLYAAEIIAVPVASSQPLHNQLMRPAAVELTRLASSLIQRPPRIPWLSNVTGTWISDVAALPASYWGEHLCRPVRFDECLSRLLESKDVRTLETGPGQTLSSFVRQHPMCERKRMQFVSRTLPGRHEALGARETFLMAVGELWAQGTAIDWRRLS